MIVETRCALNFHLFSLERCVRVCVHFCVLSSVSETVFVCSSENLSCKKKMDMERCEEVSEILVGGILTSARG